MWKRFTDFVKGLFSSSDTSPQDDRTETYRTQLIRQRQEMTNLLENFSGRSPKMLEPPLPASESVARSATAPRNPESSPEASPLSEQTVKTPEIPKHPSRRVVRHASPHQYGAPETQLPGENPYAAPGHTDGTRWVSQTRPVRERKQAYPDRRNTTQTVDEIYNPRSSRRMDAEFKAHRREQSAWVKSLEEARGKPEEDKRR